MKNFLRKHTPEPLLFAYHATLSFCAALRYGFPAKKLIVIAITGTKGKTSTANYVWSVLNQSGDGVGLIGTANIKIGTEERMNEFHMTMPGPFVIQKLLAEMVSKKCKYVVLEATSEGMKLNRHLFLFVDVAIFTNLTPEHLPSHGGNFEKYKEAKARLFVSLSTHTKKIGDTIIPKVILTNADSEHAAYYASFPADKKISFGVSSGDVHASHIIEAEKETTFNVGDTRYVLSVMGTFNIYNALPAIILGQHFGMPETAIQQGVETLTLIPGRMERMEFGQPYTVIIDYAHEQVSMRLLLETFQPQRARGQKVIVIIGAEGGGRDKAKRDHLGTLAGKLADYVIVTTVDPYDDDPNEIISDVAGFSKKQGKVEGENLFSILDRREGIQKALSLAKNGDIVLITAKGAEQSIVMPGGKKIPWDDRTVTKELLLQIQK